MNSVFVILTAVLSSGVIAALISASFTDFKERWIFRRQKIEELYLSAAKWLREVDGHYILYLSVAKGTMSYNDALDSSLKESGTAKETGDMHLRMQMNIAMYEPTLVPFMKAMEVEQKKLNQLIFQIRNAYKETGQATEHFRTYNAQLINFGNAGDNLKAEIVRRGANIAAEPTQVVLLARKGRYAILVLQNDMKSRMSALRKLAQETWSKSSR